MLYMCNRNPLCTVFVVIAHPSAKAAAYPFHTAKVIRNDCVRAYDT